ncbi:hypothetical protein PPERSA_08103 [Pseudocohnilembus persalinus]|uniref:Uncharacterized protein n=1 Tax=Pseudocohnilembus persalinus TaxID=266149 RepID=A0A0V0QLD4_PSEPJ|nr:hypothetical protein PPERSA_08103 [Pseudocohnilembus persalinus]|eukprot:KRX03028.1 hypothetical protein PPERSA_08103 [Pseudocohnilembus persalinus]
MRFYGHNSNQYFEQIQQFFQNLDPQVENMVLNFDKIFFCMNNNEILEYIVFPNQIKQLYISIVGRYASFGANLQYYQNIIKKINNMTNLEVLNLDFSNSDQFFDSDLIELAHLFKKDNINKSLKKLVCNFNSSSNLTQESIDQFFSSLQYLTNLTSLGIIINKGLENIQVEFLQKLKKLEQLDLNLEKSEALSTQNASNLIIIQFSENENTFSLGDLFNSLKDLHLKELSLTLEKCEFEIIKDCEEKKFTVKSYREQKVQNQQNQQQSLKSIFKIAHLIDYEKNKFEEKRSLE